MKVEHWKVWEPVGVELRGRFGYHRVPLKAAQREDPELAKWIKQYGKFLLIPAAVVLVFVLWKVPQWQARSYRAGFNETDVNALEPKERVQLQKDLINAENNARATLAQIIGGGVLLFGLYFTWRNIKIGQQNVKLMEEGKLTERFSKAVELLGSEKLDVRLGGIYALERIARDSQKDHWTVMEVLTAFVRENSKAPNPLKTVAESRPEPSGGPLERASGPLKPDILAAMTVIGRRKWIDQETENQRLDLSQTYLEQAVLPRANLSRADLSGARLWAARLPEANLNGAFLGSADLAHVVLEGADLSRAVFGPADPRIATNLYSARLQGARLDEADLFLVDLSRAQDLTWDQISAARIYDTTMLPAELQERWEREKGKKKKEARQET